MAPAVLALAMVWLAPPAVATAADQDRATAPDGLKERVEAHWQAKLAHDAEGAYAFLSPGYRETVPLERYRRQLYSGVVRWTDAEVAQTDCGRDSCEVRMRIRYIYNGSMSGMIGQELVAQVTERWVKDQEEWWYVPE